MNSQNQYQLSFNTKGIPKYGRAERQPRYVPQMRTNNTQGNWRNYISGDLTHNNDDALSSKNSIKHTNPSYHSPRNQYERQFAE